MTQVRWWLVPRISGHETPMKPLEAFYKKSVFRNFAKFKGKHRPATLLQKKLWHSVFLWIFRNFWEHRSYRTLLGNCSWRRKFYVQRTYVSCRERHMYVSLMYTFTVNLSSVGRGGAGGMGEYTLLLDNSFLMFPERLGIFSWNGDKLTKCP